MTLQVKSTTHMIIYLLGCTLLALGIVLIIRSELGTTPWDTLHVALSEITVLTIGYATIFVSSSIIIFVVLYEKNLKYFAMAVPVFIVGNLIDLFDRFVFASFYPTQFSIQSSVFIIGILILPLGGSLLILSKYPAGVLEEFMYTLMRVFKTKRMVITRLFLDATPLILGIILSLVFLNNFGTAHLGTLVFVVSAGPLIKLYLSIFRRLFMKLNKYIDHTYLKAFGMKEDIDTLLDEALTYDFKSVCVNPTWVSYAAESLKRSEVLVCTVIGFPLGASTTKTKVYETEDAIRNGADEIDMVINVGWVKAGKFDDVEAEIKAIKTVCNTHTLKVILETCYLTKEEIRAASVAAFKAGADFVKTSTGFGTGGATLEAVTIMADVAKGRGVKASGGVKTREDFEMMVEAGATRIGTSSGVSLVKGETSDSEY